MEIEQVDTKNLKVIECPKVKQDGSAYYRYYEKLPKVTNWIEFRDKYCKLNNITVRRFYGACLGGLDLEIRSKVLSKKKPDVNDLLASFAEDVEKVMDYVKSTPQQQEITLKKFQEENSMVITSANSATKQEATEIRIQAHKTTKDVIDNLCKEE